MELNIERVAKGWQLFRSRDGINEKQPVGPPWPFVSEARAYYDLQQSHYVSPLRASAEGSGVQSSEPSADARTASPQARA